MHDAAEKQTGRLFAVEFVSDGDPYRDDLDDEPRPAGTYLTVRLDDPDAAVAAGRVIIEFVKSP